jgi:hypothetical protein
MITRGYLPHRRSDANTHSNADAHPKCHAHSYSYTGAVSAACASHLLSGTQLFPAPGSPPPPCQWDCGQGACPANQQLNNGCYVKTSANCAQGYAPAQIPGIINTLCCPGPQPTPTPTPPVVSTCPNPVNYAFYPAGGCPVGSINNGAGWRVLGNGAHVQRRCRQGHAGAGQLQIRQKQKPDRERGRLK